MERLLDRAAALAGIGRDEIRRRNLIPADRMPYVTAIVTRDGLPMTYDSGDYPECQRRALLAAGWSEFPARQAAARREGRWIGATLALIALATVGRIVLVWALLPGNSGAAGSVIVAQLPWVTGVAWLVGTGVLGLMLARRHGG